MLTTPEALQSLPARALSAFYGVATPGCGTATAEVVEFNDLTYVVVQTANFGLSKVYRYRRDTGKLRSLKTLPLAFHDLCTGDFWMDIPESDPQKAKQWLRDYYGVAAKEVHFSIADWPGEKNPSQYVVRAEADRDLYHYVVSFGDGKRAMDALRMIARPTDRVTAHSVLLMDAKDLWAWFDDFGEHQMNGDGYVGRDDPVHLYYPHLAKLRKRMQDEGREAIKATDIQRAAVQDMERRNHFLPVTGGWRE